MRQSQYSLIDLVKMAMEEDIGPGDLTSLACLEPNPVKGHIVAKCDGVLSGLKPMHLVFDQVDSANRVAARVHDGDCFSKGDVVVEIDGFNQTVLASERVALNFLGRLSGVATLTRRFVDAVEPVNPECRILDTRKTTPGFRLLEKEAVLHGGGSNHRLGLYDMVLIKDNHIAAAGSITKAVELMRAFMDTADFRLDFDRRAEDVEIEVEVTTETQLVEAIGVGITRLLLDNQSTEQLRGLVKKARELNPKVLLEASGNVNLDTVADIAGTGVDMISIGALTHSAPVADFSLRISEG